MNTQYPYLLQQPPQPTASQFQQIQQMFPQPQGSVYSINSANEIGNVPIGSTGLSLAVCLPESLMYIKSFQNGNPVVMAYTITPYPGKEGKTEEKPVDDITQRMTKLEEKIDALVAQGGKFNGLL